MPKKGYKQLEGHKSKPPSRKGVKLANEHKRKISKALKGIKRSGETKRKLSEAHIKSGIRPPSRKGIHLKERHKKKISEAISREKHPNWQGGKSFELYTIDWTETLKRAIRERDHYTCQISGNYGDCVHHIDYDKKNCDPKNLITLSRKWNSIVNFHRKFWTNYFKTTETRIWRLGLKNLK